MSKPLVSEAGSDDSLTDGFDTALARRLNQRGSGFDAVRLNQRG